MTRTGVFTNVFLTLPVANYLEDMQRFALFNMFENCKIALGESHVIDLALTRVGEDTIIAMFIFITVLLACSP
ncbi:hypothetical protein D9M71_775390 [compost metagenome]